jgi:hypothetical protein
MVKKPIVVHQLVNDTDILGVIALPRGGRARTSKKLDEKLLETPFLS